jgi:tripartite-type tricarboxylate transporter receptor subunit TctC
VIARAMATRLSEMLGQQVLVDNRVGVGGNVGLEAAAKAPADGYTLLHSSDGTMLVNPFLYKMAVDVERELDPAAPTGKAAIFFVVRPGLPVKNLADLVAYARANPGKLNYGSAGNGTLQHIAAEMMMRVADINVTHVTTEPKRSRACLWCAAKAYGVIGATGSSVNDAVVLRDARLGDEVGRYNPYQAGLTMHT